VIDDAVTAYKGTEIDILYGVAMDHVVIIEIINNTREGIEFKNWERS
jgi:hypothetical protein